MKTWMRFGLGAAALVVAVAIGTAAYAMRGDDGDSPGTAANEDAACLVGAVECDDNPGEGSGLGQSCLVGTPDCVDADLGGTGDAANCAETVVDCRDTGGSGVSAMCAPGFEDCVDTVVEPYGDFGETPAKCAADAVDCIEPMPAPDCVFIEGPTPEESGVSCPSNGCEPAPMPDELVDPPVGAPETLVDPVPADDAAAPLPPETIIEVPPIEGGVIDPVGGGCLGIDPCTVSSQQLCPPEDCTVSSEGTTTCYAIDPICAAEPAVDDGITDGPPETVVCEDTVPPSEGGGSSGSGGSGSTEPAR